MSIICVGKDYVGFWRRGGRGLEPPVSSSWEGQQFAKVEEHTKGRQ